MKILVVSLRTLQMGSLGGGGGQHGVFLINACVEFPKGYSTGSSDKKSRLFFSLPLVDQLDSSIHSTFFG